MALRTGKTLFEAVPALSTVAAESTGTLKLVPVSPNLPVIELKEGVNRFGRDPEQADHVIASSQVSRLHCAIIIEGSDIWVRDLGSHNGTYVNRQRISEMKLVPGSEVSVSRQATFRFVLDSDMAEAVGRDLEVSEVSEMEDSFSSAPKLDPLGASTSPMPSESTSPRAEMPRALDLDDLEEVESDEEEETPLLEQVEKQRNVLAILYQIALRCLMVEEIKEREQLLSNVLPRLAPLDSGFILYKHGDSWRASICPGHETPPDQLVKAFFRFARKQKQPMQLSSGSELQQVGMQRGSAIVIPLLIDEEVTGVIGAISNEKKFDADAYDIVMQLGNVTAAALRDA